MDKVNIICIAFITIFVVFVGCIFVINNNITKAREHACGLYAMELSSNEEHCVIGDKAIPVLFECEGAFNVECEAKFIMTNSIGVK